MLLPAVLTSALGRPRGCLERNGAFATSEIMLAGPGPVHKLKWTQKTGHRSGPF